jgi:hypothetical protein
LSIGSGWLGAIYNRLQDLNPRKRAGIQQHKKVIANAATRGFPAEYTNSVRQLGCCPSQGWRIGHGNIKDHAVCLTRCQALSPMSLEQWKEEVIAIHRSPSNPDKKLCSK